MITSNIWDNYFQNYRLDSWLLLFIGLLVSSMIFIKFMNKRFTINNFLFANYKLIFSKIKKIKNNYDNLTLIRMEIINFSTKLFIFLFTTYYACLMNTNLVSQDLSIYINSLEQLYKSSIIDPLMTEEDPIASRFKEGPDESIFKKVWMKSQIVKSGPETSRKLIYDLPTGRVGLIGSETYLHFISNGICRMNRKNKKFKFWLSKDKFLIMNWAFGYSKSLDLNKKLIIDSW